MIERKRECLMEEMVQTSEESIRQWIGPFTGYALYEGRRSSDHAFRQYVLERLAWFEKRMVELAVTELAQEFTDQCKAIRAQFQDSMELLQSVPYAFGEFMTAVSIAPEQLDLIYQCDEGILLRLSAMQALVEPTLSKSTNVELLINELARAAVQLHQQIKSRQTAICEFIAPQPVFHGGRTHE